MTNPGYRLLFSILCSITVIFLSNCTHPVSSDLVDEKPFIPPKFVNAQNDTIFRNLTSPSDSSYLGMGQWNVNYTTVTDTSYIDSFQILESVVTSHEFRMLMQKVRKLPDNVLSIADSLPIDNINLRLAIVYCNELSVAMGLVPFYDLPEDTTWYSDGILQENPASNGIRIPTRDELTIARKSFALTNERYYFRDTLCQDCTYGWLSCCNDTFYSFDKHTLCSGTWTFGKIEFCNTGTLGAWASVLGSIPNVHLICVKNKPCSRTQPDTSDPEDKEPFIPPTLVKTQNDTIFRCLAIDSDSSYLGKGQWRVTYTTRIDTSFIDSFQILSSVVTTLEFKKLVQKVRKLPDFVLSIADSLPVDYIGLRLAIVYCNQLSVAMGLVPFYNLPKDTTWYSDLILQENPASNGMRIPTRDELAIARKQLALTNESFYFRDTLCQIDYSLARPSCCNDTFYYFREPTLCSGIWTSGKIDFCSTGTCGDWPFPDCLIRNVHLICVKNKPKV